VRLRIDSITLIGAERGFSLQAGLNIITGPIASGKTTLLRCMRGLFGDGLENFPREAREIITNLAGKVLIGKEAYDIVRPFVTTPTAMIDIAGLNEARRLPAFRAVEGEQLTYTNWLLQELRLPRINVPTAPTQPDSDTSPLSINDYMMYCHLT
jgi:energy-coupling factor transporter ATP-binding protein EcfA2